MRHPLHVAIVAAVLFASGPILQESHAQTSTRSRTLEERVAQLEKVVLALNERIKQLEAAAPKNDNAAPPRLRYEDLDGKATIVSDDGEFIGLISSNTFDAKSITNDVGNHGSSVATKSIFNTVGKYGSEVSSLSAWNDIASRPPKVFLNDKFIGYLTTNTLKTPRIDPHALVGYLKSKR